MKQFVKWVISGSVALVLAGLAVLQLLALFSGMIEYRSEKKSAPRSFADKIQLLKDFFEPPVRQPEPVRLVQISNLPVQRRMVLPEAELTAAEQAVKQKLEALLLSRAPTHRLVYDGGKILNGRLVEERPDYIVFAEKYGESGEMRANFSRDRIVRLETCAVQPPVVSRRDVRFYMDFPGKHFYKSPPYTILTEESFFAIEHIVEQLQNLNMQILEHFGSLISTSRQRSDVQLLIFSDLDEYLVYCDRYAPELKSNLGFYSHAMDRMVVCHQSDAGWVKKSEMQISAVEKQYGVKLQTASERERLSQWKSDAQGKLLAQANEATQSAIRHEGAHQLFFTLGIQCSAQSGRGWLTEGLATFCETEKVGQINRGRIAELKSALAGRTLIPLRELMALPRCENSLAYSEAWSLTYMLMQPEYRSGFLAYMDWVRNNPELSGTDPVQELCRYIFLQPAELELRWRAYLIELINR